MDEMSVETLLNAARGMDWHQVVLNGGPPCFAVHEGSFCGRAERWAGHPEDHQFVSLWDVIAAAAQRAETAERDYKALSLHYKELEAKLVAVLGVRDELYQSLDAARNALEEIENPIAAIQKECEVEGSRIDGGYAVALANNPEYLSGIARKALTALRQPRKGSKIETL